jgi:hypothetical protein
MSEYPAYCRLLLVVLVSFFSVQWAFAAGAPVQRVWTREVNRVSVDDSRVSREFAALGEMFQTGDLIWSGRAPLKMNQARAAQFCRDLGGNSRLPTAEEWRSLALVLGFQSQRGYHLAALSDVLGNSFWSSTPGRFWASEAFYWCGRDGSVDCGHGFALLSVICVQ